MEPSDLRDRLDRITDEGPPLAPLDHTLGGGRRALRRRRTAVAAGGAVAATLVAALVVLTGPGGADRAVDPATGPTGSTSSTSSTGSSGSSAAPSPSRDAAPSDGLPEGQLVGYVDGRLTVSPSVDVQRTITDPLGLAPGTRSAAVEVSTSGQAWFYLVWDGSGGAGQLHTPLFDTATSLARWVSDEQELALQHIGGDLVTWRGGELTAGPGAALLDQQPDPALGPRFAPPGARTAAATVERDGTTWLVLARLVPGDTGGDSSVDDRTDLVVEPLGGDRAALPLATLVTDAARAYQGGEGLR